MRNLWTFKQKYIATATIENNQFASTKTTNRRKKNKLKMNFDKLKITVINCLFFDQLKLYSKRQIPHSLKHGEKLFGSSCGQTRFLLQSNHK